MFFRRFPRGSQWRKSPAGKPRVNQVLPRVEALETRWLPSGIGSGSVLTLNHGGTNQATPPGGGDDRPPQVTNPGNQASDEWTSPTLQIVASDGGGETLSYAATNLPPGLSIDPNSGLISGTISSPTVNPYHVKVTVSDTDESTTVRFDWTITDPTPPTVDNPGDQTNNEGDNVSLQITGSDADWWVASGLPKGLSINITTGLITGTVNKYGTGAYTPTITVYDDVFGQPPLATTTFNWTINDTTPPHINPIGNQTNTVGDSVSLQVQAQDANSFSATGLPAGLSIDPTSGLISGNITASPGVYKAKVTGTDTDGDTTGLSSTARFNWTVNGGPGPAGAFTGQGNAHGLFAGNAGVSLTVGATLTPAPVGQTVFTLSNQTSSTGSQSSQNNQGFAAALSAANVDDAFLDGNVFGAHKDDPFAR
jgi:hypothetical protein